MRGVLIALAAALAGCAAQTSAAPVVLVSPSAGGYQPAKVRISVKDQKVRVESETGVAEVDFADAAAHIRLTGGARLTVSFDSRADAFHVEILEDAEAPIDLAIGKTLIHTTRGDVFDARVIGEHLEVAVDRGVVQVTGPDGKSAEIVQSNRITVSGGGLGAIHGVPPPSPLAPPGPKGPPREPRRPLIIDRTDIAPAP